MTYIIIFIVGFVSFALSVITFSQIIGSLQHHRSRGLKMTLITIFINLLIITLGVIAVLSWVPNYKYIALIGALIGLFVLPSNIE